MASRAALLADLADIQYEWSQEWGDDTLEASAQAEEAFYKAAQPILDQLDKLLDVDPEQEVAEHLPGRHNQKTHGNWARRRPGGGSSGDSRETTGDNTFFRRAAREKLADWYDEAHHFPSPDEPGATRDSRLLEIWRRQGFSGKPEVGDEVRFQEEIEAGGVEVWRGMSGPDSPEYARQFLSGDEPFPGLGIFANGTYTSTSRDIAVGYARNIGKLRFGAGPESGSMIRAVVRHDARRIAMEDLQKLSAQVSSDLLDQFFATGGPDDEQFQRLLKVQGLVRDPGRLASLLGYDVIVHHFPDVDDEYVILNRTAVIVQADVIEVSAR